jgi:hypothetical protein
MGRIQAEVFAMSEERRKKLAALSFAEKLRLLSKLRDRRLAFAASRKQIARKESSQQSS